MNTCVHVLHFVCGCGYVPLSVRDVRAHVLVVLAMLLVPVRVR